MSQEPINAESSLEEQLVAYLDGELDTESCRRIEEMLAVDPEVRRKLHWLEQTWEMLDELETTPVGEDFTRTTLELVTVAAEEDVRKTLEEAPRRRRRLWLLLGGGLLVAGLTGFMAVILTAPNPNRQLLQDLPLLENLDEYRQIKDIQFLRMLQKNGLFTKEEAVTSSQPTAVRTVDNLAEHIKTLNPSQKYELSRKQERFAGLGLDEKNRLRELHEQIQHEKNAAELRGIVDRYYEWYKTLPAYSRQELTELPAEKRIDWIENRLQAEQTQITNRPPAKDGEILWNWMEEYEAKNENKFIDSLPLERKQEFAGSSSAVRRRAVMWMMFRPQSGSNKLLQLSEENLPDLLSKFTPQTRKLLETRKQGEQIHVIQSWAHNLLRQKSRPGAGTLVSDELLADFFEKDLTPEERDRLMNLSGEDMQQELQRLYIMYNRPPEMFPHRPGEFPPGPPPGEDLPPDQHPHERSERP